MENQERPAVDLRIFLRGIGFFCIVAIAFQTRCLAAPAFELEKRDIPLGSRLEISAIKQLITQKDIDAGEFDLYLTITKGQAWTIARGGIWIGDGVSRCELVESPFKGDAANCGLIRPTQPLRLRFQVNKNVDFGKDLVLTLENGIYSWGAPRGPFDLLLWRGAQVFLAARPISTFPRLFTIDASRHTGKIVRYRYAFEGVEPVESENPVFKIRVPASGNLTGTVTAFDQADRPREFPIRLEQPPAKRLPPLDTLLVGVCIYPEEELTGEEIAALEADGKTEWGGPYRRERHLPEYYIDQAIREELGNLIVAWPGTNENKKEDGTKGNLQEKRIRREAKWVKKLAESGIYYMTIYQNCGRNHAELLHESADNKYFLGNNIGEFSSYIYQGRNAADACGVPQKGNLRECRDWFVNQWVGRCTQRNRESYDFIWSTCGAAIGAHEMEGGVDAILSELYAIGASNLSYATAEMRGGARKWKPAYWGGWLAQEWQTGNIPYQAEQKYQLLRAGLYQQYLMGSSVIVLESGTQTTQAGFYTKDSGKRNYSAREKPPTRYRKEMRDFYRYVKTHPRDRGTPETRFALANGYCDSFVGIFIDWLPQWSQYESAKKNPRWLYGAPEQTWLAAQSVLFPLSQDVLKPYRNSWLSGSPFGQVDIVQIDPLTTADDLGSYNVLAYAGWNSMTSRIAQTLAKYVENGGTLFLSLPHLSTRLDREYVDYTASDLVGSGDLSLLIEAKVAGRRAGKGNGSFQKNWANIRAGSPLVMPAGEPIADVTLGETVETLVRDSAGQPLVISQARGQGRMVLLLTWEYPGKKTIAPLYKNLLAALAAADMGDVYLTECGATTPRETDPNLSAVAYAVYPSKIYVLNLDSQAEREVDLHRGGTTETLTLHPLEFREIAR